MLVFVDESGDVGIKVAPGASSRYFTVTLLIFEDHQEALDADNRIGLLKRQLGLPDYFEFHFSKVESQLPKSLSRSCFSIRVFLFHDRGQQSQFVWGRF